MEGVRMRITRYANPEFRKKQMAVAGKVFYRTFVAVLLFALCFVILYPLLYMVSVSFRLPQDLYDPTVIWVPKHFTLENFRIVMDTISYWELLPSTLFIAIVGTIFNVASCALAGYGFARFQFKLKAVLFALVLFTIIVPPQNVSIPLYLQYNRFDFFGVSLLIEKLTGAQLYANLLNTRLTIFIPAALGNGIRSGLFIYIFRQFFRNMPAALEDAAYIDGCGMFKTFIRIIIPNAAGSFLSTSLLSFVWYYNDYFFTSMYFSNPPTLSTSIATLQDMLRSMGYNYAQDPYTIVTQMQAACLLTIAPLILVFIFLQKYFTQSIEHSGIVG